MGVRGRAWTKIALNGLACRNPSCGWAVGQYGTRRDWGVIIATRDGGRAWTRQKIVKSGYLLNVTCVTSS